MGTSQIVFIVIIVITAIYATKQYSLIWRTIQLGLPEKIEGNRKQRWHNVLLVAFGQKKMFKRIIPGVLHFFIYAAFLLTQIELIEIIIDGLFGSHRFFAPHLGGFYTFLISFIEILSVFAFFATLIFLARRNLLKIPRFHKAEMTWWPKLDANLILLAEFLLLIGIFTMNGADIVLQAQENPHYHNTGFLAISGWLGPVFFDGLGANALVFLERAGWWLHFFVVMFFIYFLPKSKHLHIFLAFPNVYYSSLESRGEMTNMPVIMNEVKSMMGLIEETPEAEMTEEMPDFGANDIFDLSWKTLMDAFTCTECGRCTSVCPANITGKKLSPRKIMMDIRDRAEEVGRNIESGDSQYVKEEKKGEKLTKSNYSDGKNLFDYITAEEVNACTTCNACVEACPVLINPINPIVELRRFEILTESAGPPDWVPMFNSIENSGSVWQVTEDRENWVKDVESTEA